MTKLFKIKRKLLTKVMACFSMSACMFAFQACYGVPHDDYNCLLEGKVYNQTTGDPILGIKVTLEESSRYCYTNEQGGYSFNVFPHEDVKLKFEDMDGNDNGKFLSKDTTVRVVNRSYILNIALEEEPMLSKKIKQSIFNRFKKYESIAHELRYLFWECTWRCNLNCRHCGSDCTSNSSVNDMPINDFLKVLDNINTHEYSPITVVITGGEPLLRKDLEECGREIRDRNFKWGIVTNGYAYTRDRHLSLINAGLYSITLSLDGIEETHNWMRNNPNSYKRALEAMELMAGEKYLNFDVVTCVNKRNINELDKIKEILIAKGVKKWRLFTITPIGRAKDIDDFVLHKEDFTHLMQYITKCRKDKDIDVYFSCEGYVGKFEKQVRPDFFFCRAGIHIASVLIDGSISACPNIDRTLVQGSWI